MTETYTLEENWQDATAESLGGVRQDTACVVRYGAFGDMIQTASVLAALKDQGWRVCVNTDPQGAEIIEMDPHVDEFLIQQKNQVPMQELPKYWDGLLRPMFGKWVNLTGSVEGGCIAQGARYEIVDGQRKLIPPRPEWYLSHEERHQRFNRNYIEAMHEIADVPFDHRPRFFPKLPEVRQARILIDRMRNRGVDKVVVWVGSGSATHKMYPYMDDAMKIILARRPRTGFILVGGVQDEIIGRPWRNERRVSNKAGKMSIRETLALAQLADVVVGPETGVLNAVSMEKNRKVVFLSHSSVENLTKHWVNTHSIHSKIPCYPCHQMHISSYECSMDLFTQMPLCTSLDPFLVARAVLGDKAFDGIEFDLDRTDTIEVRA